MTKIIQRSVLVPFLTIAILSSSIPLCSWAMDTGVPPFQVEEELSPEEIEKRADAFVQDLKAMNRGISFNNAAEIKAKILKGNLNLNRRAVEIIPESVGTLVNLNMINFSEMKLKSLPDSMKNLKNLWQIDLSKNSLTSIPEWIGDFKKLQILFLNNNAITTLPYSIGRCEKLSNLDLSGNINLDKLPFSTEDFKSIKKISLSNTKLSKEMGKGEWNREELLKYLGMHPEFKDERRKIMESVLGTDRESTQFGRVPEDLDAGIKHYLK